MTELRKRAFNLALSQIGYKEKRGNDNIYARELTKRGISAPNYAPYCAIGIGWAMSTWLNPYTLWGLPWYVPGIWRDAVRLGLTTGKPKDGDLVIYDWTMNRDPDHIGFAYPSKGKGWAVEFNTSPNNKGSQSNGDGVYMRQRHSSDIVGYVSVDAIVSRFKIDPGKKAAPLPVMREGARGPYVERVQRAIGTPVDGVLGAKSVAALKAWQKSKGLAADGAVGAATWKAVNGTKPAAEPAAKPAAKPAEKVAKRPKVKRGSKGEAVKEVQRAVGAKVDGSFGAATEKAIRAYQTKHKVKADGVVGADTWRVITGLRTVIV